MIGVDGRHRAAGRDRRGHGPNPPTRSPSNSAGLAAARAGPSSRSPAWPWRPGSFRRRPGPVRSNRTNDPALAGLADGPARTDRRCPVSDAGHAVELAPEHPGDVDSLKVSRSRRSWQPDRRAGPDRRRGRLPEQQSRRRGLPAPADDRQARRRAAGPSSSWSTGPPSSSSRTTRPSCTTSSVPADLASIQPVVLPGTSVARPVGRRHDARRPPRRTAGRAGRTSWAILVRRNVRARPGGGNAGCDRSFVVQQLAWLDGLPTDPSVFVGPGLEAGAGLARCLRERPGLVPARDPARSSSRSAAPVPADCGEPGRGRSRRARRRARAGSSMSSARRPTNRPAASSSSTTAACSCSR